MTTVDGHGGTTSHPLMRVARPLVRGYVRGGAAPVF